MLSANVAMLYTLMLYALEPQTRHRRATSFTRPESRSGVLRGLAFVPTRVILIPALILAVIPNRTST
jgi:hypothetical protein